MPDLLVLVPTRGRPNNAARLAQAFTDTCTADTWLMFLADTDDPARDGYDSVADHATVEVVDCGAWRPMVAKLNIAAVTATRDATDRESPAAVGFLGDDHHPQTPGWDRAMLDALADMGTGVVYGDDRVQHEALCTHWAMTSDIVRALGRMVPADVEHMYCDNAVMDLAHGADCLRYLPHVVVEHRHPITGTVPWDDQYRRVNDPAQYARDRAAYEAWREGRMAADVATVRALREGAAA